MDLSPCRMGDPGPCICPVLLLAGLSLLQSCIYFVHRNCCRHSDPAHCKLAVPARSSQGCRSSPYLSSAAGPLCGVSVVVVPADLSARYNPGDADPCLLSEPARLAYPLSQSIIY